DATSRSLYAAQGRITTGSSGYLVRLSAGGMERSSRKCPGGQRRTGGHEHLLATVHHVRRRRRAMHRSTHLITPEQLAASGIEREQVAFGIAAENQARCRRQKTCRRR